MSKEIPELIRMDMVKLFENPKKCYLKFCKAIRQDMETKSFNTLTSRLNCFNDICSEDTFKETAATKIEEFVSRGMVEIMLWDVFVDLTSHPVTPKMTNAMLALIQTLWSIGENSKNKGKEQIYVFLPFLVRDVIGNEKNEHQLRIEATKLINNLLEQNSVDLHELTKKLKSQGTIHDDIGTLISNAADFELQAQLLEMLFRLVPASERRNLASCWFKSKELQNSFLSIEDKSFEPGCRRLLNKINDDKKGVFSIPCQVMLFGSQQIPIPKDVDSGNHWLDFNLGSKTLKFFFEEKAETPSENEDDDVWWRTVVIELDDVVESNLFELKDCVVLKIMIKKDFTSLISSWTPNNDVHVVQIEFKTDCDVSRLREVLKSFSWIRPGFSSPPKASVAIFSVHLADRQQGQMHVVPTMDSMPPETLMEEDSIEDEVLVNNSDITATLDDKGMEESEELLPSQDKPQEQLENIKTTDDLKLHLTDSQELEVDHSCPDVNDNGGQISPRSADVKAAQDSRLEQNQLDIGKDDMGGNISTAGEAKDLNESQDAIKDNRDKEKIEKEKQKQRARDKTKETSTPPKKTSRTSEESESGTESSASRRSLRRSPRGHASNKRTKSPLSVEIIKSDRRKSSSNSGKSSTDSETERKSPEPRKPKTFPTAFNVAKRMEAKKNNLLANSSQEIKKKVFGRRGSSFGQKTSLHIMAPARRADHFKGRKSEDKPSSSKKEHSQNKNTRTNEPAGEQSEHTTEEDDEKEVIQDSMPLDDSPEVPSRRRLDAPKVTEAKETDDSLTQSESSKRTSQRIQFVNEKTIPTRLGTILREGGRNQFVNNKTIPSRLGTILRKGGPKDRDSLLEESIRTGWGSASTSSTSETDWPGPDVEPGPKPKHSLVPCKSVRERRTSRNTASQRGRKKRASISPGLSAISEEKSPIDIPHDEETDQVARAQAQEKPSKSSDSHTKKRGKEGDVSGDNERAAQESENTSEDTIVYETTSNRRTRSNTKTSDKSRASRSKKVDTAKDHSKAISASNKPKDKLDKLDFEQEFDFDLPDLTILAAEDSLVGGENIEQESAALPSNSISPKGKTSRDKFAADKKGMPLDDDDDHGKEDDEVYAQEYTTAESRDKLQDTLHGERGDRERIEEDTDDALYQEDSNDKKKSQYLDKSKARALRNKKEGPKQRHPRLFKRGFSEDDLDEDSDFPKEHKSPKRRKTYGKKQEQKYSSTLQEVNWIKDKDTESKKRATDAPRLGWQRSSKKGLSQKSLSRPSNRSDEEFHSGYENYDHDSDPLEYKHRYTEAYKRQETRKPRSRKTKVGQQQGEEQPKLLSKPKERVEEMDEEEDEETNEVLKLRRFCQDITTSKSSTPASDLPLRKRRDEETDDGKQAKRLKESKTQRKSDGQISDHSGKTSPKHSTHGENLENFADHSVPRSRPNTNERFGQRQVSTSRYKTPNTTSSRLDDSGLGRSIGTGSRRRTSVTSSKGSTTPKGRRKGELRVTTSVSKTPVTPRTSAIMRRIDEEEDFGHTKKPRQIFMDWTSSGPSRTVSTPYQEPYSPETNNDDHQDREQKRAHERLKGKGDHNPHIRPRQLFRQVNDHSPEEELDDDMLYDKSSTSEDMRDISGILSGLGENLTERLRRKRQNLQRFCKRTMDVTIETINKHFEQNLSNRDEVIDSFNDKFLEEIKTLKDEMDKAKKTEEQILARIEEDIKVLKTRRILQENKIKGLRNLCVEFQSEMIKGSDSQSNHQDAFQDEIRQELLHIQEHFLLEAQKQDRENLRRSLRSVLDATTF